jgi:hypothetical protein
MKMCPQKLSLKVWTQRVHDVIINLTNKVKGGFVNYGRNRKCLE